MLHPPQKRINPVSLNFVSFGNKDKLCGKESSCESNAGRQIRTGIENSKPETKPKLSGTPARTRNVNVNLCNAVVVLLCNGFILKPFVFLQTIFQVI